MVQEVHLAKSPPEMEADLRKCGEDIKRGLRQCVDRTYRSPRQQIQCGGGRRIVKSTPQKPCIASDDALILPKALGLTVPLTLLGRADEVVE